MNLIDDKTKFFFLMNFKQNLSRSIRLINEWIDPNGRIINPTETQFAKGSILGDRFIKFNLANIWDYDQDGGKTHNYSSSMVLNANLEAQKMIDRLVKGNIGEWSVRTIIEYEDDIVDGSFKKKILKEKIALTLKFLVLPSSILNYKKSINHQILNHWNLESICHGDQRKSRLTSNRCSHDSSWSTLYPDPKSDIKYGLKNMNRL